MVHIILSLGQDELPCVITEARRKIRRCVKAGSGNRVTDAYLAIPLLSILARREEELHKKGSMGAPKNVDVA